ncbi:ARM repeat-containing protein [Dendrothele bispora CBS 962.96]|uniref:ARM repeat-containing protein n=1 Tax=Dendrothele bispora (strain CBS 962.96) TaxID=1314807 RepID=A0A4S8LS05_DENBC|nr:ARM repeat-containing protein [Dendrothele bispora CBS 962.96]THU92204.1 ARM repeat-containing protein [Dendrothele bispora CBS 962.96]
MDEQTRASCSSSSATMISRPNHIALPPNVPPNAFLSLYSPSTTDPSTPLDSPMLSPALTFYTAPSSPLPQTPSPQASPLISHPLSSPPIPHSMLHISIPQVSSPSHPIHTPPSSFPAGPYHPPATHFAAESPISPLSDPDLMAEESFPDTIELPVDLALESEGLSTLERIYLFSQSQASYHRIFIANALPDLLEQVTPHEAIEYVLPLLNTLAMDEDDAVKDAFSSKLVPTIWWFLTHCQVASEDDDPGGVSSSQIEHGGPPTISVQAFTPILGTLLLSPNGVVGGAARYAVVALLERTKKAEEIESGNATDSDRDLVVGLFGKEERALFEKEILYQVVIGMGRLDGEEPEAQQAGHNHSPWRQQPLSSFVDANHNPRSGSELSVQVIISADNSPAGISSVQRLNSPGDDENISKPPQHPVSKKAEDTYNPYFPPLPPTRSISDRTDSPASIGSSGSSNSTPGSTTGTSASSEDDIYLSPSTSNSDLSPNPVPILRTRSPRPSPTRLSPSRLSPSRLTYTSSPTYHSPATSPKSLVPNSGAKSASSSPSNSVSSPTITHNNSSGTVGSMISEEETDGEQAAVGRLSSMSLMAAVAASGCLNESTKEAFVKEVERVARDPIYWVRREACFALGALAKVVPEEVVQLSLMPLLQNLVSDPIHYVRYSSLYALPAILSRLPFRRRRKLALDVIVPMSMDESAEVRSGVLETLGEIIYTFHNSSEDSSQHPSKEETVGSCPEELLGMFLGRTQDRRIIDGQQPDDDKGPPGTVSHKQKALEAFFNDPSRPLICAFNFPAVALTLGRSKWPLLRETYLSLTHQATIDVHRTAIQRILAASLGDVAKIIGPENAQRDLIQVWWNVVKNDEDDVRMKAVECFSTFVSALGKDGQMEVLTSTLQTWESGAFKGWREREVVIRSLSDIIDTVGQEVWNIVVELETVSLLDSVNAVREAGIYVLPKLWSTLSSRADVRTTLAASLAGLAHSASSRKRMTFVACQQALVIPVPEREPTIPIDDAFVESIAPLVGDDILGVRIGVARLIGILCIGLSQRSKPIPPLLHVLAVRLAQDLSSEVRAYVNYLEEAPSPPSKQPNPEYNVSTFSRPPPFHATS